MSAKIKYNMESDSMQLDEVGGAGDNDSVLSSPRALSPSPPCSPTPHENGKEGVASGTPVPSPDPLCSPTPHENSKEGVVNSTAADADSNGVAEQPASE